MSVEFLRCLAVSAAAVAVAVLATLAPVLAVAVAAGAAVVLAMPTRLPWLGFLLLVALVPLDALGQLNMPAAVPLTLTKVLFPPILLAVCLSRLWTRRPLAGGWTGAAVLLFGGVIIVSGLLAGLTAETQSGLRHYVSVLLLFLVAANLVTSERQVLTLLAVVVGSCVASSLIGLGAHLTAMDWIDIRRWGVDGLRLAGASAENPNTFATNLLVGFILALAFALSARRVWVRVGLLAAAAVLLVAVAFAMSRAVSLVLVVAMLHLLVRLRHRMRPALVLLLLAGMVVVVLPLIPVTYFERMVSLVTAHDTDMSLRRRLGYHLIGWDLLWQHPLWGVGPENFGRHYLDQAYRFWVDQVAGPRRLHNTYLLVACELGLLGLAAFGAIIASAFHNLRQVAASYGARDDGVLKRAAEALEVALAAFLLSSLFLPNVYEKFLWILVALSAALAAMRRGQLAAGVDLPASPREAVRGAGLSA